MKTFVAVLILALAVAVPALTFAGQGEMPTKPEKTKVVVAHLAGEMEIPEAGGMVQYYRVIEISENALDAHLAHGDVYPTTEAPGTAYTVPPGFEEFFDVDDDIDEDDEVPEE
ncbi:MAG TPA: hypothetical protein VMY42_17235 [Thermoguttaceae bacterium]|nr:hypothetical protein [Thermoguttaceae bacterium]